MTFALERISGLRLPELMSREIWQKLGVEESACYTVDPAGYGLAVAASMRPCAITRASG